MRGGVQTLWFQDGRGVMEHQPIEYELKAWAEIQQQEQLCLERPWE